VSADEVKLWPFRVLAPRLKSFAFHAHFLPQDLPVYFSLKLIKLELLGTFRLFQLKYTHAFVYKPAKNMSLKCLYLVIAKLSRLSDFSKCETNRGT
jgi:hypothetical protein